MLANAFDGMFLWWGMLFVLLIGETVLASRSATRARVPARIVEPTAREILAERLARGDLNREEYEAILARYATRQERG